MLKDRNERLAVSQMAFRVRKVFGTFEKQALVPVVQKVDNAIHRINHCPLDSAIGFASVYPLDSDLSGG